MTKKKARLNVAIAKILTLLKSTPQEKNKESHYEKIVKVDIYINS